MRAKSSSRWMLASSLLAAFWVIHDVVGVSATVSRRQSVSSVPKGRHLQDTDSIMYRKGMKKKKMQDRFTPVPTPYYTPTPAPYYSVTTMAPTETIATATPTLGEEECIGEVIDLDNDVLVEFQGRPEDVQPQEIELLEQTFVSTYNSLVQCDDGGFRALDAAVVDVSVIQDGRRLSLDEFRELQLVTTNTTTNGTTTSPNPIFARSFVYRLRVRGRCRGCVNNRNLFDQGNRTTTAPLVNRELTVSGKNNKNTPVGVKGKRQSSDNLHQRLLNGNNDKKSKDKDEEEEPEDSYPPPTPYPTPQPVYSTTAPTSSPVPKATSPPVLLPCPDCIGPNIEDFTVAYNQAIQTLADAMQLTSIDAVKRVVELEDVECDVTPTEFESDVFVDFEGVVGENITASQLNALERGFLETYNSINALNPDTCDLFFREVIDVEIISNQNATFNRRRLVGGRSLLLQENMNDDNFTDITASKVFARSLVFLFRVRGRCRGCRRDANLFDDAVPMMRSLVVSTIHGSSGSSDVLLGSGRHLQTVEDDCVCPVGTLPELRAPNIEEFIVGYNETVQILNARNEVSIVTAVTDATEVDPVECAEATEFETQVLVGVLGNPEGVTEEEIGAVESAFARTYNELAEMYCDPSFRSIIVARIVEILVEEEEEAPVGRLLQSNGTNPVFLRPFRFLLYIRGRCRGCRRDANLYDETLRRLQAAVSTALGTVRRLEEDASDTCYCSTNPIAPRAPTVDEFQVAFNQTIIDLELPNVIAITTVEEVDDLLLPSAPPSLAPTNIELPPTFSPSMSVNPTAAPSLSPTTLAPSPSPTTMAPSANPTTLAPSPSPTTLAPSPSPTTLAPSPSPTTLAPSPSPTTLAPSPSPTTLAPTFEPTTSSPTFPPTRAPSSLPTQAPSISPSSSPTTPTTTPTSSPAPSPGPSPSPTNPLPSSLPTGSPKPSPSPSSVPSSVPTPEIGFPTTSPAPTSPSAAPTESPVPTPGPSDSPTMALPSSTPTQSPAPSPNPTGLTPTFFPTVSPVPSNSPTGSPAPTPLPSSSPTLLNSAAPTSSSQPSSGPTAPVPSSSPSTKPTATDGPTISSQTPSTSPTISNEPSVSTIPSTSFPPSIKPSTSFFPSSSAIPSISPSISLVPSASDAPSDAPSVAPV